MAASLSAHLLTRQLRAVARSPDRAARGACECQLVQLYRDDPAQRAHVIEAFRPFASSFAVRLKRGEEPLDDLRQVAMVGLIKALERFDPDVGRSFTAYAAPTILGELRRHYRDTGWAVHVPRAKQELAQRLAKAARQIEHTGRDATDAGLANTLGIPVTEVAEGRLARGALRASFLEQPAGGAGSANATLADLRGELDPNYQLAEHRATLAELIRRLSLRDREIVTLRFDHQLTQAAIGRRVGISQMQVSRALRRIITDLQETAATNDTIAA